jgi:hypothetical protein
MFYTEFSTAMLKSVHALLKNKSRPNVDGLQGRLLLIGRS